MIYPVHEVAKLHAAARELRLKMSDAKAEKNADERRKREAVKARAQRINEDPWLPPEVARRVFGDG